MIVLACRVVWQDVARVRFEDAMSWSHAAWSRVWLELDDALRRVALLLLVHP